MGPMLQIKLNWFIKFYSHTQKNYFIFTKFNSDYKVLQKHQKLNFSCETEWMLFWIKYFLHLKKVTPTVVSHLYAF